MSVVARGLNGLIKVISLWVCFAQGRIYGGMQIYLPSSLSIIIIRAYGINTVTSWLRFTIEFIGHEFNIA